MKSDYKVRAYRFLTEIWPYIEPCFTDPFRCESMVMEYNRRRSRKAQVYYGSTRIVIACSDYVIKYDYCNDVTIYGGCEEEERFYRFAKKKGFAHLFAETTVIRFHEHTFSIMPRVYGVGDHDENVEDYLIGEEYNFVTDYLYDMHNENYGWKNGHPVIIDYACNKFLDKKTYSKES